MEYQPIIERDTPTNHQRVFRFPNGYGASVVNGQYTYGGDEGLFELAVLKFDGDGNSYSLTYETPITDDVIGYLSESGVESLLKNIAALPGEQSA